MKDQKNANTFTLALFIIYLFSILYIIVFKFNMVFTHVKAERQINFIPFVQGIVAHKTLNYSEILLNILIFIPLGLYISVLKNQWRTWQKVLLFFGVSFLFESLQYIFKIGAFDVTDLINNTLGGIIGLLIYLGINKAVNNNVKIQSLINIISAAGTILILAFLLFLKIEHLWLFRM